MSLISIIEKKLNNSIKKDTSLRNDQALNKYVQSKVEKHIPLLKDHEAFKSEKPSNTN